MAGPTGHQRTTRANTTQRVFGDAGTEGLCAPSQAALARLTQLAAFFTERADDPGATYCRQLQGAVLWFGQLLARDFDGAPCLFNADLDEVSWLVDNDPDGFNRAVRQECNERWLALCEGRDSVYAPRSERRAHRRGPQGFPGS
ncbi:hypothetical protein [Pseudomonas orientalis]|uniref:hypothetical protein n=1 Tax=Pseudomonas orientalis TaxID=76758 RepID=UPI0013901AD6|nr:hypothetical protein [Pseudomonas orientalis]